jgi:hypothetical protein
LVIDHRWGSHWVAWWGEAAEGPGNKAKKLHGHLD